MAWIVEEEKEFVSIGQTRTGKVRRFRVAHWHATSQCEEQMKKVLENLRRELPASTFHVIATGEKVNTHSNT